MLTHASVEVFLAAALQRSHHAKMQIILRSKHAKKGQNAPRKSGLFTKNSLNPTRLEAEPVPIEVESPH